MNNQTETRIVHRPTSKRVVTKFKSPSLIRTTDDRPPTEYSSATLPAPTQFNHSHTVRIEADWLAVVFLPSIISLLMLMVLAFTALTAQDTSPIDPTQVTDVNNYARPRQ